MQIDLKIKNIVLIGAFNPSMFDKYFFIKNNIVKEEDILPTSVFNQPGACQLITEKFHFFITTNQVVLTDLLPGKNDIGINQTLLSISQIGAFANVTASGINFHFFMEKDEKSIEELSREYFFNERLRINEFFKSDDSMFGTYLSTNFKDSRLKLDVKPNTVVPNPVEIERLVIAFIFNFHFEVNNKLDILYKSLNEYNEYEEYSNKIISTYK